jgi:2-iminobutanoate/2-iminopropanoate deaminase
MKAILTAAGADFGQVVRTTIFLKDLSHFNQVNEVYGSYFKPPYPARACVEVSKLPKDVDVEIDAIVKV